MTHDQGIVHIIDDDAILRAAIKMTVVTEGFDARAYASALDFLSSVRRDEIGCVVTDVEMPKMTGIDLLTEIEKRGLALPVIVMSGHCEPRLVAQALQLGAIQFIAKPFDDAVLIAAVRKALTWEN